MQQGVILSRLFVCKPLVLVLSVVFSSHAWAATSWKSKSAFSCPAPEYSTTYSPAKSSGELPLPDNTTRIVADKVIGQTHVHAEAQGNVIIEHNNDTLNAEHAIYDQTNDMVHTKGSFTLSDHQGNTIHGDNLHYHLNENSGSADNAEFTNDTRGRRLQGISQQVQMHDKNHAVMKNVQFNTCNTGDHSWYIQASELRADRNRNIGVAKHARLIFGGVPILYTPWIDFPLSGNRKSGFLLPSMKIGSNGTELELPYYLNFAPNYDATLSPGIITARGATLSAEMRYLEKKYSGIFKAKYLPYDRRSRFNHRYEAKWQHSHQFSAKLSGSIDYHQVSDDDYYRDLYGRNDAAENVQLNRRLRLEYHNQIFDAPLQADLTLQKYQTLSDSTGRKNKPYALLPRLSTHWQKNSGNMHINITGQFTRFVHSERQNGNRALIYPSIQWNFNNSWGYIRPKIGIHATYYWLNKYGSTPSHQASRILPIANIDSGFTLERKTTLFGRNYIQTLEPRLFYNYIPRKSQINLPNFDSSENNFSYNQLFRENLYSGGDLINSSNSLTIGLQTRLLNSHTGAERWRAGIGQKFYFNSDNILLNGSLEKRTRQKSDIAAFAGGQIGYNWFADANIHYDQNNTQLRRADIGVRYNPIAGKVLSLRYKYGRDEEIYTGHYDRLRHIDFGAQWPINPNLYAVGRLNYSLKPRTALEQMLGLEYRSPCGCWSANIVGQRYINSLDNHKTAVFFTLQLKDLSNIGSNPYEQLRLGIPGYHKTNEVIKNESLF